MKKMLVLLAAVLAFTLTSVAQTSSSSSMGQSDQTTTTTKTKSKKSAASSDQTADDMGKSGKAKKTSTLTGCLSAQPDTDGMYTLSNGRYKKGIEVGPTDKLKDHAGHQVALKGQWATAAAAGETATGGTAAAGKEKGEKHFEVASLKHISDTCKEAPGGGTTGATKKGKKAGATDTNPPKQ